MRTDVANKRKCGDEDSGLSRTYMDPNLHGLCLFAIVPRANVPIVRARVASCTITCQGWRVVPHSCRDNQPDQKREGNSLKRCAPSVPLCNRRDHPKQRSLNYSCPPRNVSRFMKQRFRDAKICPDKSPTCMIQPHRACIGIRGVKPRSLSQSHGMWTRTLWVGSLSRPVTKRRAT